MTAISWAEPAPAKPRGAHRRPAEPKPRKRLLPGRALRKLVRRTGREVAMLGGGTTVAGAAADFMLLSIVGLALIGLAIFVGVKW